MIGGSWARDLDLSAPESPHLAFIVGLHAAPALALVIYFWRDWVRIGRGLVTSIVRRQVAADDQRLAWRLVLGTIPVASPGCCWSTPSSTVVSKPVPAAAFLLLNGLVLLSRQDSASDYSMSLWAASAALPLTLPIDDGGPHIRGRGRPGAQGVGGVGESRTCTALLVTGVNADGRPW